MPAAPAAQLTTLQTIALGRSQSEKALVAAMDTLPVGEHRVSFTCRVEGTITRDPDTDKAGVSRFLSKQFLALALRNAGVTREAALEAMLAALHASETMTEAEADEVLTASGVRDLEARLEQEASKVRVKVRGATRVRVACQVLSNPSQDAQEPSRDAG